jgi:sigma-54 dependent transcriptional regulator, acetoin dehydrogenase operon transcriptional activator AcoR
MRPRPEHAGRIQQARASFFGRGELPDGLVAETIRRSWSRCAERGLSGEERLDFEPTVLRVRDLQERNANLLSQARGELQNLYEQIANTGSMVLLSDSEGVIIDALGDPEFVRRAQRVALQPGASWREDAKGTNAIGTAIVEREAVVVHGAEHYVARNEFLTCSAAPIFGPGGQVVGVLDVSGDHRSRQLHTLALVRMSAQLIENRLIASELGDQVTLHFHSRPEFIGTLGEGVAVFDGAGRLLAANRSGLFQLGIERADAHRHDFESLFEHSFERLLAEGGGAVRPTLTLHMHSGVRVYAWVENVPLPTGGTPRPRTPAREDVPQALQWLDLGDARVRAAIARVRKVLQRDIPVVLMGETGTGKEVFARAIHEAGPRRNGPFVAVNCAAIPEGLIESELFGYEEGAFTGARRKGLIGKVRQADGGTLFLDEIGDTPMSLQARLLRTLQERLVCPLGSSAQHPVDIRVICATNRKLREAVAAGEFRQDLYYRLNGLQVTLPPLRERSDLPRLVARIAEAENGAPVELSREVLEVFKRHPWPGNIRQLQNVLRMALVMMEEEDGVLCWEHLPEDFFEELEAAVGSAQAQEAVDEAGVPRGSLEGLKADAIIRAIEAHSGNISAAARALGVCRNTLYRRLRVYSRLAK